MKTQIKLIDLQSGNSFENKKGEVIKLTECIGNDFGVFFEYDFTIHGKFTTKENNMEVGDLWNFLETEGYKKSNN